MNQIIDKPLILAIDDSQMDLDVINHFLEKSGFRYINANSGEMGFSVLQEQIPDCILVDNNMPGMKGVDFCKKLKSNAEYKFIPVIMLTCDGEIENIIEGLQSGADDYIEKSADPLLQIERIKTILRSAAMRSEILKLSKAKDEFLSIVSHDLRGPIGVVRTSMELLMGGLVAADSKEGQELISRAHRQSTFALDLTQNILDLGRLEGKLDLTLKSFFLKEVIDQSIETYIKTIYDKRIYFNNNFKENYRLHADQGKIQQLLNNLIGNAVKFTPENGRIDLEYSTSKSKRSFDEQKDVLHISVANTGPLIPKEHLSKIFNKYVQIQSEKSKYGAGLGLAICKQICLLHKGNIKAESTQDGTCFKVDLPNIHTPKKILIFDQNESRSYIVKKTIETLDYQVLLAKDNKNALELLLNESVDLLLINIDKKEKESLAFIKQIRSQPVFENLPIVVKSEEAKKALDKSFYELAQDTIYNTHTALDLNMKLRRLLSDQVRADRPSILIVDDDYLAVDLLWEILKQRDVNVFRANDGIEGLFLFRNHSISLVITDIRMPELDGIELAGYIKEINPEVPIIFTGYGEFYEEASEQFGAREIVVKPFSESDILQAVDSYLKD